MKIFGVSLIVILLSASAGLFAQSYVESALQFSRTKPWGSARIQGMGGAQIALGGDYSSAGSNPAGIGMYNRSEFAFSPGLNSFNTTSNYFGESEKQSGSKFIFPGLSLVFHIPNEKESNIGFQGGALAITMSRTNDFNRSISYHGTNPNTSIIDSFIDQAWGNNTDQFSEDGGFNYNTPTGLAYYNYLIGAKDILDPPGPDTEYFTDAHKIPFQTEQIQTTGSTSQWNFAYGANFNDMFFVGGGVGISSLRYKSQKVYGETFDDPDTLQALQLKEDLSIRGSGINATLGITVRPVHFFQVGVSYTTPTYYSLSESYNASMSSRWGSYDYYGDGSEILGDNSRNPITTDQVISDYTFRAPSKISAGIAFLSKYGLITGDIDMSRLQNAHYSTTLIELKETLANQNTDIKTIYKRTLSYRVGAEFRYNILRVRAGYAMQGNTLASSMNFNNQIQTITGGIGIKRPKFYIDLAVSSSSTKSFYNPYTFFPDAPEYDYTPTVDMKHNILASTLTFGFTF